MLLVLKKIWERERKYFNYFKGNVALVPIVAEMGIGLGMLIWGSVQVHIFRQFSSSPPFILLFTL